ncbi:MAG: MBL fold metallo-hydrolase [Planctomycetes bacterium]|nr:MBL fold metallo-hydrolase [Planctomycetota bacterium]
MHRWRAALTWLGTAVLLVALAYLGRSLRADSGDVTELAPGVFFREQDAGCNNGWIVFDDYVLVIDANFPVHAEKVVAEIKRTTQKPIRFVFDTHYHGDHAFGNAIYTTDGAVAVATEKCLMELVKKGHPAFEEGKKDREDFRKTFLANPTLLFDTKIVFDDGKHRVEMLYTGHAHTVGDAVAYLPKEKIVFTGDACVNGPYNYTGDGDTENWIKVLDAIKELNTDLIAPGHGKPMGRELLDLQRRYFVELRAAVQAGIDGGKSLDEIKGSIDLPFYKEWTGVEAKTRTENIEHVYKELTGMVTPASLLRLGLQEGPSLTKSDADWAAPKRLVVSNMQPAELANLRLVAPGVEVVPVASESEAVKQVASGADGVVGLCSAALVKAGGKRLRWIQVGSAGVENYVSIPELVKSDIVLTNAQRLFAPEIADHVFAMLLSFTRGLRRSLPHQITDGTWERGLGGGLDELRGKTMLVIGLGGIGTEVARRAAGFQMQVVAVDPRVTVRPDFVRHLGVPGELNALLPVADAVVICSPLTGETRSMIASEQLERMKRSAYLINIARGPEVDMEALVAALQAGRIAGAGLDVTNPEPLPADSPLWKLPNVILTPHIAVSSPGAGQRRWLLWRENVRRFAAGEPLLSVVDKEKGY